MYTIYLLHGLSSIHSLGHIIACLATDTGQLSSKHIQGHLQVNPKSWSSFPFINQV